MAFGKPLSKQQSVRESIAQMHCDIEQARLLTLKAADKMDRYGNKVSRDLIAAIKIVAPTMACNVIDQAIQMHALQVQAKISYCLPCTLCAYYQAGRWP